MAIHPKKLENLKKRKSWKKGQSGNPKGSSGFSRARAQVKKLSAEEFENFTTVLFTSTKEEVEAIAKDPDAPFMMQWMARAVLKGHTERSIGLVWPFLERLHGKAKESVTVDDKRVTALNVKIVKGNGT